LEGEVRWLHAAADNLYDAASVLETYSTMANAPAHLTQPAYAALRMWEIERTIRRVK
jgi:hypothetical protein